MFWRLGSDELSLPVAAAVWLKVVWMRPSSPHASTRPSTVDFIFWYSRCAMSWSRKGCPVCAASFSSSPAAVEYPVFVFFVVGRPRSSNRTFWSCLGLDRLRSGAPAMSRALATVASMRSP